MSRARAPAHTRRRIVHVHARVCSNTHGCTIKRPTFSVTLKTTLFLISLITYFPHVYVPVHACISMRRQMHIACYPPKQQASSAWKLSDGRRGAHLLQLDIFHGNRILMRASQKRHVCHTDPMAEIIPEWSCLLMSKLSQRKRPRSRAMLHLLLSLSIACFPLELMGHDLDQQSMIAAQEADISDNWVVSTGIWVIYSHIQSQLMFILSPVTQKISSYHLPSSAVVKAVFKPLSV